ncbi:MAG TPA: PspC domain-containing protein [Firmicutes bacterium]|nr:PspC domain-containing protein [Candidatus Fermentithermobacillaceae bacterium]
MKKLYRSRRYRVIGGVAGGLAEYFDVDVTIIRLAIALMAVIAPNVVLAYILAWIIIPETPKTEPRPGQVIAEAQVETRRAEPSTISAKPEVSPTAGSVPDSVSDSGRSVVPPTAGEILDAELGRKPEEEPGTADIREHPEPEVQADEIAAPSEPAEVSEPVKPAVEASNKRPAVQKPAAATKVPDPQPAARSSEGDRNRQVFGYFLILIGALVLVKKYVPYFWFNLPMRFFRTWWPVAIIAVGLAIVFNVIRRDS